MIHGKIFVICISAWEKEHKKHIYNGFLFLYFLQKKKMILSENFYDEYVKNFSFLLFPQSVHISENFMQKSDGSFRYSNLVSPVLYLILQALGKEIHSVYTSCRTAQTTV